MAPAHSLFIAETDVNAWLGSVSPAVIITGLFVFGLPTIVATINGILAIWKHFKNDPPIHKVFATKEEVAALETRIAQQLANAASSTAALEYRITQQLNQGELLFNSIQKELHAVAERSAELRGVVSTLRETMASLKRPTR
jgi:hypothetical protein